MSPAEVRRRVKAIRAEANDAEAAHGSEDALYEAVLHAIAAEPLPASTMRVLALEALKTKRIKFGRYCA